MYSIIFLITVNIITIIVAVVQGWSFADVMWLYWIQSVLIGLFQLRKILDLKEFSTKNFRINNRSVEPTRETQLKTAGFFAVHYNGFHLAYLVFLWQFTSGSTVDVRGIAILALAFFLNHYISYRSNKEADSQKVPNIGTMMFKPYARIIPMHLTIVFLPLFGNLVMFMGLKSVMDVIMHRIEHRQDKSRASI